MFNLKTNNLSVVFTALLIAASAYAEINFIYESTGVRDPMVKPISIITPLTDQSVEKTQVAKQTRLKELQKIISERKIEGVVFSADNKPLLMIDNKIIAEGDRISKKSNIFVAKIELKKVVFSLDNETITYVLSPLNKEPEP